MFGSSSSESAERTLSCEGCGVFAGLGQPTTRYNSSLQSTATSTTLDGDMHPEDSTSSPKDGVEQAIADVEANGAGEPGKIGGRGDFEDSLTSQILGLALPALVSLAVDPLMSAVDTMYIGRLDPSSAAARLIGQLLTSALIIGSVMVIILETAGPAILYMMEATAYNEVQALSYLRARAASAPAVLLMNVGNGAFRASVPSTLGCFDLCCSACLSRAGLGVEGAAMATAVAEWSGALAFLFLLSRKEPTITQAVLAVVTVSAARIDGGISIAAHQSLTSQILGLALPALVSIAVDPLMSAVDSMFIGRLDPELGGGAVGLGALAINTNVFLLSFITFGFLATVPTPFVASARARGDEVGASRLIGQLLTSALIMGSVMMIILETAGPAILRLMGATANIEAEALSYLQARATSAPAVPLMLVGNGPFRGFLDTKTPLLISLGATALNFTLDPIFIFAAGLGVEGAAMATAVAEWSGALAFLFLLSRKEPSITSRKFRSGVVTVAGRGDCLCPTLEGWTEVRKVVTSSSAVFSRSVALQGTYAVVTASAARIGDISIAAHQVAAQFWIILAFMADSMGVAAQGLVADRMGAGSIPQARHVARRVLTIGVCSGIAALAVVELLRRVLPLIFASDEKVLSAVAPIMGIVAAIQPINVYVFTGEGVLQGSQDFVFEALSMLLSSCLAVGNIIFRMNWGSGGGDYTLVDVWTGQVILSSSRALGFTFRHFLDPTGQLAVKASSESGDGGYGKAPSDEDGS